MIYTSETLRHRNNIIIYSLAAMFRYHKVGPQDVVQAYIQGYDFQRYLYIQLADQFKLSQRRYLNPPKDLYRLSESEVLLFHQYIDF